MENKPATTRDALTEAHAFIKSLLDCTPDEATDLLTNHGEDVEERLAKALAPAAGQHTKGKWRIGDAGLTVFGPPNGNPSPEVIARCYKREHARLIAAAPEMLEFLTVAAGLMPLNSKLRMEWAKCISSIIAKATQGSVT